MGKRIVWVSPQLWRDILTVGNRIDGVEVVEGLPVGAVYRTLFYEARMDMFGMVWSHPDWPDVEEGEALPEQPVIMRKHAVGDSE